MGSVVCRFYWLEASPKGSFFRKVLYDKKKVVCKISKLDISVMVIEKLKFEEHFVKKHYITEYFIVHIKTVECNDYAFLGTLGSCLTLVTNAFLTSRSQRNGSWTLIGKWSQKNLGSLATLISSPANGVQLLLIKTHFILLRLSINLLYRELINLILDQVMGQSISDLCFSIVILI